MSDKIDYVKWRLALRRGWTALFLAGFLALSAAAAGAVDACPGDANGDGRVTIGEVIGAVRNALDGCPLAPQVCHGDADCDGSVTVNELVQAVGAALEGCVQPLGGRIVGVSWLRGQLGNPNVQVIDARVGGFPGGHIPGAIPLSPYALATVVDGVEGQIVGLGEAEAVLSAAGLRRPSIAVVYGAAPEFDPARVVWALTYFGHRDVRYLDGGWKAWVEAGAPVAAGPPLPGAAPEYVIDGSAPGIRVDGAWLLERLGEPPYTDPEVQIIDARSPGEYAAGAIPSALHRQWTVNLEDGLLLPANDLESLYAGLDKSRTTVVYCLAGWRASVAWLVLTTLGFEDVRVYDGSWLEWGNPARGFPIDFPWVDENGVVATCRSLVRSGPPARDDVLEVRLTIYNDSGVELRNIAAEVAVEGGTVEPIFSPGERTVLPDLGLAIFDWAFGLSGSVSTSAAATAMTAGGQAISLGPVECGSASSD